jgi:hypothetical protein
VWSRQFSKQVYFYGCFYISALFVAIQVIIFVAFKLCFEKLLANFLKINFSDHESSCLSSSESDPSDWVGDCSGGAEGWFVKEPEAGSSGMGCKTEMVFSEDEQSYQRKFRLLRSSVVHTWPFFLQILTLAPRLYSNYKVLYQNN